MTMTSDVDCFCVDLIYATSAHYAREMVRLRAQGRGVTSAAGRDLAATWGQTGSRIRQALAEAKTLDDLPAWMLDLGDQLGVQRPSPRPQPPLVILDDSDDNADWLRHRWPDTWPTDRAGLLALLADLRTTVDEFKTWPLYRWNVENMPWLRDL